MKVGIHEYLERDVYDALKLNAQLRNSVEDFYIQSFNNLSSYDQIVSCKFYLNFFSHCQQQQKKLLFINLNKC